MSELNRDVTEALDDFIHGQGSYAPTLQTRKFLGECLVLVPDIFRLSGQTTEQQTAPLILSDRRYPFALMNFMMEEHPLVDEELYVSAKYGGTGRLIGSAITYLHRESLGTKVSPQGSSGEVVVSDGDIRLFLKLAELRPQNHASWNL